MIGVSISRNGFHELIAEEDDDAIAVIFDQHRGRRRLETIWISIQPRATGKRERIQDGFDPIFMAKPILKHVELQPANRRDQDFLIMKTSHDLDGSLLRHLRQSFVECFAFADVGRPEARKDFRLKLRQRFEIEASCQGYRITDRENPGIDDSDDIAGVGLFDRTPFLRHQAVRSCQPDISTQPVMLDDHIPFESS